MPPDYLPEALRRLDPGSRALLDLSLRQSIPDAEIAELLRVGVPELRRRRAQAIEAVAIELGIERPSDRGELRKEIAELPSDAWSPSRHDEEARASVVEEAGPDGEGPVDDQPAAEDGAAAGDKGADGDEEAASDEDDLASAKEADRARRRRERDTEARSAVRVQPIEAGGRRRRIPFGVVAALVVLVAVGIGVALASSRSNDGDPGTTQGETTGDEAAQGGGEDPGGEDPGGEGEGANGGETEGEGGGGGSAEEPVEAGTPLEPLPGREGPGKATARLAQQDGQLRVELTVRGLPKPDGAYEVWLYESLTNAVSIGRFRQGRVELVAPLEEDPAEFTSIDISLEPADGNPNHSGRSLLRVPIEKLRAG